MRYGDFKNEKQKEYDLLVEEVEIFFAFSKKQLLENKKENTKYYNLGMGMFCPQDNFKMFENKSEEMNEKSLKDAKKLFTPSQIIGYELANHEYICTYNTTVIKEVLEEFCFSDDEYRIAIKEYLAEQEI